MKPEQCRAARSLLGLSLIELGHLARVSETTIGGFERGQSQLRPEQHRRVRASLVVCGIKFSENDEFFGVHRRIDVLADDLLAHPVPDDDVATKLEHQIQQFLNAATEPDVIKDGRLAPKRCAAGLLIERVLQRRGLQGRELATQMQVSSAYVSAVLTGKSGLSPAQAAKFGEALDLQPELLLRVQTHERQLKKLVVLIRRSLETLASENDVIHQLLADLGETSASGSERPMLGLTTA